MDTATGITIQAWIDGGSSDPEATVSLSRSEHEGLYELVVTRLSRVSSVLLDSDSLHALLSWTAEQS